MNYKTIETEKRNPSYAALNPDTGKIYISYETSNLILIINNQTGNATLSNQTMTGSQTGNNTNSLSGR